MIQLLRKKSQKYETNIRIIKKALLSEEKPWNRTSRASLAEDFATSPKKPQKYETKNVTISLEARPPFRQKSLSEKDKQVKTKSINEEKQFQRRSFNEEKSFVKRTNRISLAREDFTSSPKKKIKNMKKVDQNHLNQTHILIPHIHFERSHHH